VEIDVGFGGGGRHERHIVEGRKEYAAIEGIKVHVALEIEIGRASGFSAIARRVRAEKIFGAATQARDVPGDLCRLDRAGYTRCKSLGERNHASKCLRGKNAFECGADRG